MREKQRQRGVSRAGWGAERVTQTESHAAHAEARVAAQPQAGAGLPGEAGRLAPPARAAAGRPCTAACRAGRRMQTPPCRQGGEVGLACGRMCAGGGRSPPATHCVTSKLVGEVLCHSLMAPAPNKTAQQACPFRGTTTQPPSAAALPPPAPGQLPHIGPLLAEPPLLLKQLLRSQQCPPSRGRVAALWVVGMRVVVVGEGAHILHRPAFWAGRRLLWLLPGATDQPCCASVLCVPRLHSEQQAAGP